MGAQRTMFGCGREGAALMALPLDNGAEVERSSRSAAGRVSEAQAVLRGAMAELRLAFKAGRDGARGHALATAETTLEAAMFALQNVRDLLRAPAAVAGEARKDGRR